MMVRHSIPFRGAAPEKMAHAVPSMPHRPSALTGMVVSQGGCAKNKVQFFGKVW
jgi:hypothetical protein